jgi:hypothetical protein
MPDDLPRPPGGGDPEDRPASRPTEPLQPPTEPVGPPPPAPPPPGAGSAPTAPVPEPPAAGSAPGGPTWPEPTPAPAPGYGQPGYGTPYGGQAGYGQPGYGAQPGYGYGYPAAPQTDSSATAALVIAVVGFFVCPPVGAVVALVMANSAQKRIEASEGRLTGLEMAKAARIIAIIELVLTAVLILVGVLAVTLSLGARY